MEQFKFNSADSRIYSIKNISPNGIVTYNNGKKARWKMKDVRQIAQELPSLQNMNQELLSDLRQKFHVQIGMENVGRIIYNIYHGTFEGYL